MSGISEFEKGAEAMREKLQHYLNAMHVYCRLAHYMSKARARQWAKSWETAWLYNHVVYSAKQKEVEYLYGESIDVDRLNVPPYLWDVRDHEMVKTII